jgi:hypothetical protein
MRCGVKMIRLLFLAVLIASCGAPQPVPPTTDSSPDIPSPPASDARDAVWAFRAPLARAEDLQVRAEARTTDDSLHAWAILVNTSDQRVRVEHGHCALRLRLFRGAERTISPHWHSEYRMPWNNGAAYGCSDVRLIGGIEAEGEYSPWEFSLAVPLVEVLADSLPDGRYFVAGELELNQDTLHFPVGEVELALERPLLASTRVHFTLTYQAETEILRARPTALRTRVTAIMTHGGSGIHRFPVDCPVVLHAYRSRERRDAAPRVGGSVWQSARNCREEFRKVVLHRQQREVFEFTATAAQILGDSLPPGRYYFAAAVQDRPPIFLSAGEAELRQ